MKNVNITIYEPSEKLPSYEQHIVFLTTDDGWCIGYFSRGLFIEEDSHLNNIKFYSLTEVKCWYSVNEINKAIKIND